MINMNELKKLHAEGLSLIYLRPKSKRPFETAWTSAEKKSWDELENSFDKSYNVGVRLGQASKLTTGKYLGAIDCDVKENSRAAVKEMNEALRKLGIDLDSAPIVTSGRGNGSKHIYVQTIEPMRALKFAQSEKRVKVLMPGEDKPHSKKEMLELTPEQIASGYRIRPAWEISFMGTGQQTVLPPSIHPDSGFAYAWARPLSVKRLPIFKPEIYQKLTTSQPAFNQETPGLNFKAEDVNLYETKLSVSLIKLIEEGRDCEDRSAGLFSVTLAMCRLGFTDNQILSVLSDESNWIASAAYEHTQSRDRRRAVAWLYKYTLLKARYETDIMRRFDNPPKLVPLSEDEASTQEGELQAIQDKSFPDLDGNQKPKTTLRNVVHALEHFMGGKLIGFNEFNIRYYFLKDTPYGGIAGREISDHDDVALKHYISCHYRFEPSKELCFEAHSFVARKYTFHPVREYLEGLVWDEVPRLDTWLKSAFKASGPEDYLNAVSRKVLVAAVARIFEPGCKFDYVMVLEGFQGKGKSTALRLLAGDDWFTDRIGDIHSKDVVDQMAGKWIIELSELASIRKAENEAVKSFMSCQTDRVRMSYGKRSQDYPRQSILVGSTNSSEYFSDETGNRRYWPVAIEKANRKWLMMNRDQLWAEAVMRYHLGETIYLSDKVEALAQIEQEARFEVDEWEVHIKKIIEKDKGGLFVITELWQAINISNANAQPPMGEIKRIAKILKRLGLVKATKEIDKVLTRCWVVKDEK